MNRKPARHKPAAAALVQRGVMCLRCLWAGQGLAEQALVEHSTDPEDRCVELPAVVTYGTAGCG